MILTKCGYVAVIGRPNAGKSSLLNWLIGEKITMVSHKANATRKRSNIIVMHRGANETEESQIIFIDTPGLQKNEKLINRYMLGEALKAIGDCDLILFLAPITDKISYYKEFLENNTKTKHFLILTKIDFVKQDELFKKLDEYKQFEDSYESIIPVSIKKGKKQNNILDPLIKLLPKSPYMYDPDILTDEHIRYIYKEFIRESIFDNISDEIPYETDVKIEEIKEKKEIDVIKAVIIVEKNSQKSMLIGREASSIKRIGKNARLKIETLSGKKAYLELYVKVKKGWSKNKSSLSEMGYDID